MVLGNIIKTERKKQEISQEKLAEEIGISRTYLSDIENNRYNPSFGVVLSIAKYLNISLEKFEE